MDKYKSCPQTHELKDQLCTYHEPEAATNIYWYLLLLLLADRPYYWYFDSPPSSEQQTSLFLRSAFFHSFQLVKKWLEICGEEFIEKAFQYAHEADPDALLFYNDYNTERPEKRERIYKLLKRLVDKGVPVHGVGLQAHWSIYEPSEAELRKAIEQYSSLGLQIHFTELDVSVYPWEKERRARRPGESDVYTAELQRKQADQYRMFFRVFREYKKVVTSVTFWNISDRTTWLDMYPVRGRKNYPLLFDTQLKPKEVYWDVVKF